MTTLNPWINFNGNAEEAFTFYKSVFGGEFTKVIRFKDIAGPEFTIAKEEADKIMQIALSIGGGTMLLGNDVPSFMGTVSEREHRSKIHVGTDSKEEAEKIFNGLSIEGEVEGPLSEGAPGAYFGTFRDKYDIEWIIEYNPNK
jgi:PhnB protein